MITLPNKPKIVEAKKNKAVFEIENCYPGYGTTLGNSFRRVLLSSLPGAAVTGVKIKGVQHEFSTIPHIKEDVVQIILNLKQVRFRMHIDGPAKATLKIKGEKEVTAADIKTSSDLEVVNPEARIAALTDKKAELEMELEVERGLGYSAAELRKKGKIEIGKIAVDAIFTPVLQVNYSIEPMRVGERTDYDRLRLTIITDGTITPKEAFSQAVQILVDHFEVMTAIGGGEKAETKEKKKKSARKAADKAIKKEARKAADAKKKRAGDKKDALSSKIEDLKISSRTVTALREAGLKTAAGLIRKSKEDLAEIEGLGEKGVTEIKRILGRLGLTLKEKK
jgi:DNA-directed RNA polymerase subunit alpha